MQRTISICDISVRRSEEYSGSPIPFRTKVEVAKLLSKLGVSVIETPAIKDCKTDYFLVKSLSSALSDSIVSVPVDLLSPESVERTWEALKGAAHPRLKVSAPVSTVQMEYFCHKKPAAILQLIGERVAACAALCANVEFVAEDFSRSEPAFLSEAIAAAVNAGATLVTVADAAGDRMPDEFGALVAEVRSDIREGVRMGVYCANDLHLADACAVAAVRAGADEVKTMAFGNSTVALKRFSHILSTRPEVFGASCGIDQTRLQSVCTQVNHLCEASLAKSPMAATSAGGGSDYVLSANEDKAALRHAVEKLGYELSEEDMDKVYDAFSRIAADGESFGAKEIDAIVASVAFQVPPTYRLDSFVINTGNVITPTCHVRMRKGDEILENVCVGEGPVDAAFMAIEKVVGRHYELDDFKIRAVTEGREAMGETIVRLRHEGQVYSGRGVSKDIVASSLMAYINAVNKIAYGEEQV